MKIGLIADTSCDLTPSLKKDLAVDWVPFQLTVNGVPTFIDNEDMDLQAMISAMTASKEAVATACPGPEEFAAQMRKYDECVVVTISSKLSGSYNAAVVAKDLVLEETPEKKIHLVDTKSACGGETRVAMEVRALEEKGLGFDELCAQLDDFVANMHTTFVLENLSNLVKNGRMSKVAGAAAMVLGIHPVLRAEEGEILMEQKVRGMSNALKALVEKVAEYTKDQPKNSMPMAIAHCNAQDRAKDVKKMIEKQCPAISKIEIVPTKGLSSVYANVGGVVLAY